MGGMVGMMVILERQAIKGDLEVIGTPLES